MLLNIILGMILKDSLWIASVDFLINAILYYVPSIFIYCALVFFFLCVKDDDHDIYIVSNFVCV
jgi:hypothetical protein